MYATACIGAFFRWLARGRPPDGVWPAGRQREGRRSAVVRSAELTVGLPVGPRAADLREYRSQPVDRI